MRICRKYPVSYEILLKRAYKRKKIFERYRAISLLTIMKGILKFQGLFMKIMMGRTLIERANISNEYFHVRKNLYHTLYYMYQYQLQLQ